MPNRVTFSYAKETDNQEYFDVVAAGQLISSNRPPGHVAHKEKARIYVAIDKSLITKREVLGVLPVVLDIKRAYELERVAVLRPSHQPFLEFNFNNHSLDVRVDKEGDVTPQEMDGLVKETLRSILGISEDYFLQKKGS